MRFASPPEECCLLDGSKLPTWKSLLEPDAAPLLELAQSAGRNTPRSVAALRARWPRVLVELALELACARRKAARKFGGAAAGLIADVQGVEQATGERVAAYKAGRYEHAKLDSVVDLCCGIGGDARALARRARVVAIDVLPVRAWMAARNSGAQAIAADAAHPHWLTICDSFHCDPARRIAVAGGRTRTWTLRDHSPGLPALKALIDSGRPGAVKLGPGVRVADIPQVHDLELEFVSDGGELVQAILWCGALAWRPGQRTATALPGGWTLSASPSDSLPCATESPRYLHVADPALERARLLGCLCESLAIGELAPGLGILASTHPVQSPWLESFTVVEFRPWHPDRARAWLRSRRTGRVDVKTRGNAVDAGEWSRTLSSDGDAPPYFLFVLRAGAQRMAYLCTRESASTAGAKHC